MDLETGIKKILDHEGVLFLGSGFSTGGINSKGEKMKVGAQLSRALCRDLGISESDDLTITSQRYIEDTNCKKTVAELINFLKKEVYCMETSEEQDIIAGLHWKRIYTTNYDNAFEIASEKQNLSRKSITITNSRYSAGRQLSQAIIHINGSVLNLTEESFFDEFKITDENYTRDGLLQSSWKSMFDSDLETAGVVVFIGYSLQYDQELVRHMANLNIKDKCIFIDIDFDDPDKEYKISRYGNLQKIGSKGFAQKICEIKKNYIPSIRNEKLQGFQKKEVGDYYSEQTYGGSDVLDLLVKGKLNTRYMNQVGYCINRKEIIDHINDKFENNDLIVIQSRLGNGKSVLLECIANYYVQSCNVFVAQNMSTLIDDLNIIQSFNDKQNIILIDDYGYYIPLLKELGRDYPDNLKIIMTSRTSINTNLYQDLFEIYGFNKDRTLLVDVDEMTESDVRDVVNVLNRNRLWGIYDRDSIKRKKELINRKYKKRISNIFYLLLKSKVSAQ